jgi:hypothetical protein
MLNTHRIEICPLGHVHEAHPECEDFCILCGEDYADWRRSQRSYGKVHRVVEEK